MKRNGPQSRGLQSLKDAFYMILKAPTSLYWESCAEIEAEIITQISTEKATPALKPHEIEAAFVQLSKMKTIFETQIPTPQADELLKRAREAFKQKDYQSSFGYFDTLLKNGFKADSTIILHAATAAYYAKQFISSQKLVDQVLAQNELDHSAIVLKGLILMEFHKWKDAARFLTKALEHNPHSKVVQQSLQICRERITSIPSTSLTKVKRQWLRIPVKKKIQINDFGSYVVMPYEISSLSAGGCLINTTGIPREFQFRLEVTQDTQICGLAKVVYETSNRESGIKFESLTKSEQLLLDETIKGMSQFKGA